ncbi:hypothetical protein KI387_030993 [Taxus chinensis]|uniref:NAD-dependent epimerase/dehydratase domain-containing protein n=1 Tax=Taxus chinensis TaxID=29808 RepID=A0AA38CHB5_TAXCH|nr:hypothetical protein KI387_030993 [Taxus chinensis]
MRLEIFHAKELLRYLDKKMSGERERVCVTAATGFIGSCLVKNLLEKGFTVHATCRDPENPAKTGHLLSLPGAKERLHLFKADLSHQGSFDSAIEGCDFLINLATSMEFDSNDPECLVFSLFDGTYQTGFIRSTIDGTVDILRACKKAKTVRRVIHTSSITAASPLDENGNFKECLDESCWTPVDYIRAKKPKYWMYYVTKTLAEQAALQCSADDEIEVVTVCVALVGGPSFTPTFPSSISQILTPITGNRELCETVNELQSLTGSIPMVHIEDVCHTHIFLMQHPFAVGRYLCCSDALTIADMADFFSKRHQPVHIAFKNMVKDEVKGFVPVSSKKLTELGFSYKYGMEEIVDHGIQCAKKMRVLSQEC